MTLEQNITAILETHFSGFKDELIEACAQRIMEQVGRQADQTDSEIPKNALRSACTGCRFVGIYDTQFPCKNCLRKNKDYYDSEYTEGSR